MSRGKLFRTLAMAVAISMGVGLAGAAVTPRMVYAESISISETKKSMQVGDMFQLKVNGVEDSKATYSWSSSAPSIATVNSRGIVNGVALGTAVITCRVTKSDKTTTALTCTVTVRTRVAATGIAISNANYELPNAHVMTVGERFNFRAALAPSDSTDKVYWEVADSSYALVTGDGVVVALKPGITRLIACAGKDESSARADANKVQNEIYIYIKGSASGGVPTATPTPAPGIYGTTPTPTPTPSPWVTVTPVPANGNAEIQSVTMVSGNTLRIQFGKPVLSSYVIGAQQQLSGYFSLAGGATAADYGTLTAVLSEDHTVLTVTASKKFDGTYVLMVSPGIVATDGTTIARYVQTLNLRDTTGPEYLGTELDVYGYTNTLRFSEPIDISNLSIVAVATSCTEQTKWVLMESSHYELSEDKMALTINLNGIDSADENKELMIGINGIMDEVGNRTSPSILTVTVKTDTALRAPAGIVSVKRTGIYEIQVTFDMPLYDAGYLILNSERIYGSVSAEKETVATYVMPDRLIQLTGNQVVGISGWYSYNAYGSVYSTVNQVVDFTVPVTAPQLKNMWLRTTDNTGESELILEYDREITLPNNVGILNASYRATNGDIRQISATYVGTVSGNKATLTIYNNAMTGSGIYTISLPVNLVTDSFNKYSAATTFAVTLTSNVVDGKLQKPTSVTQDTMNASNVLVRFGTRVDEATATNVSNYVLGNYTNPLKAELVEQGQDGATIRLTFSEGAIPYDAEYPIRISGIKGYNNTYKVMDAYETELYLVENIAPVFASAYFDADNEIVLTFFETTALSGAPEFRVYYNGKDVAWFSYISVNNTVRIFLNTDITRGTVTILAADNCNLTDTSGNTATLNGVYTATR